MKVATWNIERLNHRRELDKILFACEQVQTDILVLTETDSRVQPRYPFSFHTPSLSGTQSINYRHTENRVSIFTRYRCVRQYATYDENTALCVELETELGNILVYGTIIGVYGNRNSSFMADLKRQAEDFCRLSAGGKKLCICGDFNCSFSDNYYFTTAGRSTMLQTFSENNISLLTADIPECIDHVAVSDSLIANKRIQVEEWNCEKKLSDHKGIAVFF